MGRSRGGNSSHFFNRLLSNTTQSGLQATNCHSAVHNTKWVTGYQLSFCRTQHKVGYRLPIVILQYTTQSGLQATNCHSAVHNTKWVTDYQLSFCSTQHKVGYRLPIVILPYTTQSG